MANIDKKKLSESDICLKYISPSIVKAGWDLETDIRTEVTFVDPRKSSSGKKSQSKGKRADYVLSYQNIRLAIVEAKKNTLSVGAGMQQAIEYGEILEMPFVFSSNGDGFVFRDATPAEGPVETELELDEFPAPQELLRRYQRYKGLADGAMELVTHDYYSEATGKEPRYYQTIAIQKTLEAIAKGQDRVLLVMATGTGKTYTAFQIIWRLWKGGKKKRILFLVDRNILADQARNNDFKPFGAAMTKISKGKIDKSYEIYLALYQAVTGKEEDPDLYKEFSRDFFDLVVVDECHRGSARENSLWREILEYFSSATQIGLTATPKESKKVSNADYFGEAVYTYSLKQGIEDGFLAPYKVIRFDLDKDFGWRPDEGQTDKRGRKIEEREYTRDDMDRGLVLEQRTELVARKISEYLRATNRYDKTIVFCQNIPHAERMRGALANENRDLVAEDSRYVMRITGDEKIGKQELDNFINPEERYPVIATTSKLLSTGVDARTCKLVVLDQNIKSLPDFKQIIGRGTRLYEDPGNEVCPSKQWFTIMDFRQATKLFADPKFDGPPEVVYEPRESDPVAPPEDAESEGQSESQDRPKVIDQSEVGLDHLQPEAGATKPRCYVVNDVPVYVTSKRVEYYGSDNQLISASLEDYTSERVKAVYPTLDAFVAAWSQAESKSSIIGELREQGVVFEALADELGKAMGPYDLVCEVVFGQPALTRVERAAKVRERRHFAKYNETAQAVLNALLDKFALGGFDELENMDVLRVQPISDLGSIMELIRAFGGREDYLQAVRELESAIYST